MAGEHTHPFDDPVSGRTVILHLGDEPGVEHHPCPDLADVMPDLDAWYCSTCGTGGRISGAWFMDLLAAQ